MIRRRLSTALAGVALVWVNSACGEHARAALGATQSAATTDTARANAESRVVPPDTMRNATLEPGALKTVSAASVSLWTGPGGRPFEVVIRTADPASAGARRFGTVTLPISLRSRTPNVGQYPCTSCHLGKRTTIADDRITDAHRNITAVHPVQTGSLCSTCHAADNVEFLALKSGERATLDHTYRLCAQCHFSQAEAWAGGAHGKRLDGWQGRRVLLGCADCHDPHKPAIEPRIPFRAPRIERLRGDQ
ncbi:MAG TPA: hypothetical protein VFT29_17760 [Gemmatimonadaceae bacterium]|nr:hypothetical protein [Gemmatimonadaceae bacterium]